MVQKQLHEHNPGVPVKAGNSQAPAQIQRIRICAEGAGNFHFKTKAAGNFTHPDLRSTVSGPIVFSHFLKTTGDLFYNLVPTLPDHRSALKESSLLILQFLF